MRSRALLSIIMFLTLVPVTLPVAGLQELVIGRYGASSGAAHAFMTVNMIAGMIGVPLAMVALRHVTDVRRWLASLLLLDAALFVGMGAAPSVEALLALRALDGLVHLPAITLLMVAGNRVPGERRAGSLGVLASALMLGVTVGSPLGGVLVDRGVWWVYLGGALLFVAGAALCMRLSPIAAVRGGRSYYWNRRLPETWVPLAYAFMDRFSVGIFVSTFTLFLATEHGLSASARGVLAAMFMLPFAALCYPAARLAEARGWLGPMLVGNLAFGAVYASYGIVPVALLPIAMIASGVASALIFAPSLLLVSDLVRRGQGEGLFGAFQISGSLGFLAGPIVGGIATSLTSGSTGRPAYEAIFASVGALELLLAGVSFVVLRRVVGVLGSDPTSSVT